MRWSLHNRIEGRGHSEDREFLFGVHGWPQNHASLWAEGSTPRFSVRVLLPSLFPSSLRVAYVSLEFRAWSPSGSEV